MTALPQRIGSPDEAQLRGPVVAIGNFDGVHRGHRLLLSRMRELARDHDWPSLVVTFFPPSKVLFTDQPFLSSAEEKLRLLAPFAPDAVAIVPFTREYARTDKEAFVAQLARLEPAAVIVGEDFRFGHERRGTLNDLSLVTPKLEVFRLERQGEEVIKSSRIRDLLAAGEVAAAARLLGEPYLAMGAVVEGDRRGREIGFPTANLRLDPRKALPLGVFSVRVRHAERSYQGMANCGARPTFPGEPPSLEAHLFDFSGDLYGEVIELRFIDRIRSQRRFESLDEIRAQLREDERQARRQLAEA